MIEAVFSILCLVLSVLLIFENGSNVPPRKRFFRGLLGFLLVFSISITPLVIFSNLALVLYLIIINRQTHPNWDFWHLVHCPIISVLIPTGVGFTTYYIMFIVFHLTYAYIISSLLTLVVSLLLSKQKLINQLFYIDLNPFIISLEILGSIILFIFFRSSRSGHSIFIYLILFSTLVLIIYKLGEYIETKKSVRRSYNMQLLYSKHLEELNNDLSAFKHDYINLLLTLKKSIDSSNLNEVNNIFYNTILPSKEMILETNTNIEMYKHLKIIELKNLLLAKEIDANTRGIDIKLTVVGEVSDIGISSIDLIRIVSILLDNAVQASELISTENTIYVNFTKINNELNFSVKNSIKGLKFDRTKLFQKEYTTSDSDSNMGIGLYSLQRIIDKNPYIDLVTEYKNDSIVQSVIISN